MRTSLPFRLSLLFLALFLGSCRSLDSGVQQEAASAEHPKNVILFISDGCGPASFTMARDYLRYKGEDGLLAVDGIQTGSIQTHSTDSRVTDSAAGATALACGVKTYNGAIGVDTLRRPVTTLVEAAEAKGLATGLVTTTSITHATPAAFSAHVPDRSSEFEIASQQIEQGIDVLFGGGVRFYLPEGAPGGDRADDRDLFEEARQAGYQVVRDAATFRQPLTTPVLGLFADNHLPYELDRDDAAVPSLAELTAKAIELLSKDKDGFVLMVEGGRIDHAAHGNDAATHLGEVLAYDAAVAAALDFARRDGKTLVVATSDHETGGLTLGRDLDGESVYQWNPAALEPIAHSMDRLVELYRNGNVDVEPFLARHAGIAELTEAERQRLASFDMDAAGKLGADDFYDAAADLISRRAIVGWTSGGHTAVDVNLYAFGPGSGRFVGHFDNTYVGRTVADLLGVNLRAVAVRVP